MSSVTADPCFVFLLQRFLGWTQLPWPRSHKRAIDRHSVQWLLIRYWPIVHGESGCNRANPTAFFIPNKTYLSSVFRYPIPEHNYIHSNRGTAFFLVAGALLTHAFSFPTQGIHLGCQRCCCSRPWIRLHSGNCGGDSCSSIVLLKRINRGRNSQL